MNIYFFSMSKPSDIGLTILNNKMIKKYSKKDIHGILLVSIILGIIGLIISIFLLFWIIPFVSILLILTIIGTIGLINATIGYFNYYILKKDVINIENKIYTRGGLLMMAGGLGIIFGFIAFLGCALWAKLSIKFMCPNCQETVKKDFEVCPHCQEILK